MYLDDDLKSAMGKAIHKGTKCWTGVEPRDLINLETREVSDMIVELVRLRRDLESGSRNVESIIKDLNSQINLLDKVLDYRIKLDRRLKEAEQEAACE